MRCRSVASRTGMAGGKDLVGLQCYRLTSQESHVTMTLSEEIASWDGKSAAALQSTYERHSAEENFVAMILAHFADVELQRAATWLLKKHLEVGNSLSAAGVVRFSTVFPFRSIGKANCTSSSAFPILTFLRTTASVWQSSWMPASRAIASLSGRGPITDSTNFHFASHDTGKRWTDCWHGPSNRNLRRFRQESAIF